MTRKRKVTRPKSTESSRADFLLGATPSDTFRGASSEPSSPRGRSDPQITSSAKGLELDRRRQVTLPGKVRPCGLHRKK